MMVNAKSEQVKPYQRQHPPEMRISLEHFCKFAGQFPPLWLMIDGLRFQAELSRSPIWGESEALPFRIRAVLRLN